MKNVQLLGRVIITGKIIAQTGLHIGGSPGPLAIGNVDMPVIRNVRTGQPYIPGSSLKGKMRSLCEKLTNAPQNKEINKGNEEGKGKVEIHVAKTMNEYNNYWVNPLFGIPGDATDKNWDVAPNRLIVRDIPLSEDSIEEFTKIRTDLPFTEVKWEAAIDRVTSAATPRQIERVPAGAVFSPMEMVLNMYLIDDVQLLNHLITALKLVEDDYLGGLGSRGSGKIEFQDLTIAIRHGASYEKVENEKFNKLSLSDLSSKENDLRSWVSGIIQ